MVRLSQLAVSVTTGLCLVSDVTAHPGHDVKKEYKPRAAYLSGLEPRALAKCAPKLQNTGAGRKMMERREAIVRDLRRKAGFEDKPFTQVLQKRDFDKVLKTDHASKLRPDFGAGLQSFQPDWTLLGQNKSVVLSPETTEGPYYVAGESIRRDVKDGLKGVNVMVDIQMISMETCEPMKNVAVDIWGCDAVGVYHGVTDIMAGSGADQNILQSKALRGIQISDADGSVTFDTLVPGHYMGRTPHIHIMTSLNATVNANQTISGGKNVHIGQFFFDQSLIDQIEKTAPYNTNKQPITLNAGDWIMRQEAAGDNDPVVEYVLLGDKIEDGLFAWLNFGVDPSAVFRQPSAASICSASGCVAGAGPLGALGGVMGDFGSWLGGLFGGARPAAPGSPGAAAVGPPGVPVVTSAGLAAVTAAATPTAGMDYAALLAQVGKMFGGAQAPAPTSAV